jgi:hypothetical protein
MSKPGLSAVKAAAAKSPKAPAPSNRVDSAAAAKESTSQFTLKMRTSLHKELARMALDRGMTMRGYIMKALKGKGLSVTDDDLKDRRKR